jgi:hypothetical protein
MEDGTVIYWEFVLGVEISLQLRLTLRYKSRSGAAEASAHEIKQRFLSRLLTDYGILYNRESITLA